VLGISALTLDVGKLFRPACIAVLIHASVIMLIAVRRGSALTTTDTFVVKWGLLFVLVAVVIIAKALGRL
jgi:hypothetical protein